MSEINYVEISLENFELGTIERYANNLYYLFRFSENNGNLLLTDVGYETYQSAKDRYLEFFPEPVRQFIQFNEF